MLVGCLCECGSTSDTCRDKLHLRVNCANAVQVPECSWITQRTTRLCRQSTVISQALAEVVSETPVHNVTHNGIALQRWTSDGLDDGNKLQACPCVDFFAMSK
jgi:hypothetical protein